MLTTVPNWLVRAGFALVSRSEWLTQRVNRLLINSIVSVARNRPHPWSTLHDYTSWRGLTDLRWSARHLPPKAAGPLPEVEAVVEIFRRPDGEQRLCPKSTCLFPAFAQYLTDGFIRTDTDKTSADHIRRNTSNHQIDLCPLYGRTRDQTLALRTLSETPELRGRLKSQTIDGEEFAPYLYAGDTIDPTFAILDAPLGLTDPRGPDDPEKPDPGRRAHLFAFGGDRTNSVPQVAMINTLLLREHNRLAGLIAADNPGWDDDRVFETARNTVTVLFIKLVVEDYINHITPLPFRLRADPIAAWTARWNRPNWITAEFSLLYRWHALIPDSITWNGAARPVGSTFMDMRPLVEGGLLEGFVDMSDQRAGEIGPLNTTKALIGVEKASILQGRANDLATYADYCDYVAMPAPRRFEDISSDPRVASLLAKHYATPRDVEFYVGLFASDRVKGSPLPQLILRMVAVDAFSQALTNPLLSEHVFNEHTFSPTGWKAIHQTHSLRDIVARNVSGDLGERFIGMTRPGWTGETAARAPASAPNTPPAWLTGARQSLGPRTPST